MNIYLASPLGFAESTRGYLDLLLAVLEETGHSVFNPWSQPEGKLIVEAEALSDERQRLEALKTANTEVARANEMGIRSCDWVLAVLDGVDVDSGTASEIGFAFALQKRILGLRTDFRRIGDNAASLVNLQVQYWIEASGGMIVSSLEELRGLLERERVGA